MIIKARAAACLGDTTAAATAARMGSSSLLVFSLLLPLLPLLPLPALSLSAVLLQVRPWYEPRRVYLVVHIFSGPASGSSPGPGPGPGSSPMALCISLSRSSALPANSAS